MASLRAVLHGIRRVLPGGRSPSVGGGGEPGYVVPSGPRRVLHGIRRALSCGPCRAVHVLRSLPGGGGGAAVPARGAAGGRRSLHGAPGFWGARAGTGNFTGLSLAVVL